MGAGKNFLNWLQGTFGGNNDSTLPDFPLPVGGKSPKPVAKKAAPKKAVPKKKEA